MKRGLGRACSLYWQPRTPSRALVGLATMLPVASLKPSSNFRDLPDHDLSASRGIGICYDIFFRALSFISLVGGILANG